MHETVIANNIIKEAKKHGAVKELHLEIGELAHVPADELVECLEKLVSWKIIHTEKPSDVECNCGYNGHPTVLERGHESYIIECPNCKSWPKVTDGKDIKIVKVIVN